MAKQVETAYGDALFELCAGKGTLQQMYEQAILLSQALKDNPELLRLLVHPDVSGREKDELLVNSLGGFLSEDYLGTLRLMCEKAHAAHIPQLTDYVIERYKEHMRIGVVTVKSAREIAAAQKKALESRIMATAGYKSLEVTYLTDEDLIGGIRVQIGGRVMDSSVRMRMDSIVKGLRTVQIS